MKKNILIFGLIAGCISTCGYLLFDIEENFDSAMVYGFGSMLLAFALIFVGTHNYRNKYNGGTISFGEAFVVGLGIAFVASTVYVAVWEINYFNFNRDFIDKYTAYLLEQMKQKGKSQAEIDTFIKEQAEFKVNYNKVWYNSLVTYMEIFPIGILVSLISAAVMRKKRQSVG